MKYLQVNRLLLKPGASVYAKATTDGSTSSPRARLLKGARPEPVEGCEFQNLSQGVHSPGFTLIEVILAMGVLTSTIFIISGLMMRSFLRVEENRDDIEKVFLIERELYANYFKPPRKDKKNIQKIEEPAITITSELGDINKKSSLHDFAKNLKIIRSDAIWKMNKGVRESTMLSFVFQPQKEEQKR